jgi:hypothetical protein
MLLENMFNGGWIKPIHSFAKCSKIVLVGCPLKLCSHLDNHTLSMYGKQIFDLCSK